MNHVQLLARVAQADPLAHTPAGLPVVWVRLEHETDVSEAGTLRRVSLTIQAVALGEIARTVADAPLGVPLGFTGFLAPRRQGSDRLVLHIQQVAQAH